MSNAPKTASAETPQIPEGPLLGQLAGMPEARSWAEALVQDLVLYKAGRLKWSDVDAGCVLYGPTGTGKTTLARAIAATAKVPLIATSYADWTRGGRYGADIMIAMRATFDKAREHAPCVVAIDELDSMPARSTLSSEHIVTHAIVNALLEQLDGLNRRPGVVVIGACNHHDRLDEALIRSGRLGRSILVPLPALDALPQILAFHLADDAASVGDLRGIAVLCVGMSGADIEQLVRDARQRARRAARPIRRDDLISILEARSKSRDPETERRIAVHEAGHAVADLRLGVSGNINVSIVATASAAGRVAIRATDAPQTRKSIEDRLVVLLAGRAAEETILGSVSGGAGGDARSDLGQATHLAFQAIGTLGLSAQDTLIWYGRPDVENMRFHPTLLAEAREMLNEAYSRATVLVAAEQVYVELIAADLVRRRGLTHQDMVALDPHLYELKSVSALAADLLQRLKEKTDLSAAALPPRFGLTGKR